MGWGVIEGLSWDIGICFADISSSIGLNVQHQITYKNPLIKTNSRTAALENIFKARPYLLFGPTYSSVQKYIENTKIHLIISNYPVKTADLSAISC